MDPDAPIFDDARSTLVEFFLHPQGDGVRLRVVESGFGELDLSAQARRQLVDERTNGWTVELGVARTHTADVR